jgi:hypothetical protein
MRGQRPGQRMKIDPNSPLYAAAGLRAKRRAQAAGGTGFSDLLDGVDGAVEATPAEAPSQVAAPVAVGSILSVQEISEDETRRGKALKRGHRMLDALEDLRLSLFTEEISPERIGAIREQMQERQEQMQDPRLREIMREIEIRAAVELAKRGF